MTLLELIRSIVGERVRVFSFAKMGYMIEYIFACMLSLVVIVLVFRALFNIINLFALEKR